MYEDEFEEYRARANSGGMLPESKLRAQTHKHQHLRSTHITSDVVPTEKILSFSDDSLCGYISHTVHSDTPKDCSQRRENRKIDQNKGHQAHSVCNEPVETQFSSHVTKCSANISDLYINRKTSNAPQSSDYEGLPAHINTQNIETCVNLSPMANRKQYNHLKMSSLEDLRPRVYSMPTTLKVWMKSEPRKGGSNPSLAQIQHTIQCCHRIKSFTITPRGLKKNQDLIVSRRWEDDNPPCMCHNCSCALRTESFTSQCSIHSADNGHYKVAVTGNPAVGKTTLVSQLSTSNRRYFSSFGKPFFLYTIHHNCM